MKKFKLGLLSLAAMTGLMLAVPQYTAVAAPKDKIGDGVDAVDSGGSGDLGSLLQNVVNILLFILGAIAVIMIVVGGIRYATSNGDSGSIKSAKDTILYAVIGLIVALLAYAIVNFVLSSF